MATMEPIRDPKKIQEMKKILQEGSNGFRNRLLFELGLATALRISDILRLKKRDIQDGFVRIKTKKTGRYKLLQLNAKVYQMLLLHIETLGDDDPIFKIKRGMASKIIKDAAEEAGIPNINTHSLRKTAAYHFYYQSGKDIIKTMNLLGHRSPEETTHYVQLSEDEVNNQLRGMYL